LENYSDYKICIPVELIRYVIREKLGKAFALFIYLKCHSSGKVHEDSPLFLSAPTMLGIKDQRTFHSYLSKLQGLNWVGYNVRSRYYFIRGFDFIRKSLHLKSRKAAIFDHREIDLFANGFLQGVLICERIKAQQYYWEVSPRKQAKFATKTLGVANQNFTASDASRPPYYGLSNKAIAELLNCKMTRACELKQQAESGGYLRTKKHFEVIARLPKPDFMIKKTIAANHPELGKRVRFRARRIRKQTVIEVLRQLHDEILPQIGFKNIKRFIKIK
jgi:hypothetical protein